MAEIVGIDPKHQSCIENGKNFPSTDLIEKYAKAFRVDSCDLLNMAHCAPKDELVCRIKSLLDNAAECDVQLIYKICLSVLK